MQLAASELLRTGRLFFEYDIPSYAALLTHGGMVGAYRLHRSLLQALTWRCQTDRLVLKDPFHIWHLAALLELYPDARLVHTHRDPLEVLPSAARLCAVVRSVSSDDVRVAAIAGHMTQEFLRGLERGLSARAGRQDSFHDVRYTDLVRNPLAEARRIYQHFEMAWSDDVEGRMRRWLDATAHAERRARRHDDLASLGLVPDTVRSRYAEYSARFRLTER